MGIIAVYVIYLLISALLTVLTAVVLARSGKTFLTHVFGGDAALGRAVATLFVVGSCLLNLGFVVLAMRTSASVQDTRQAVELLSVKLGEVLLITGLLHLINVLVLTSVRRRTAGPPDLWRPGRPGSGSVPPSLPPAKPRA
ncbi:MAG TPA: hypothetical protein VF070_09715 [Streptosporangiaceae bacterium]